MNNYSCFDSPENRERKRKAQLYQISERVASFFYDDAPEKFKFETRDGQIEMAFEILDAMLARKHIVVEAGVGIGKSFAYLVPLLLYHNSSRKPVVVATSTIALQEQLYDDIERLKELLNVNVPVCLCKGQTHYICKARAYDFLSHSGSAIEQQILSDVKKGLTDRSDFGYQIPQALWDKVNIFRYSRRSCAKCEHYSKCYYCKLRAEMLSGNGFFLCNQDLMTAHLKRVSQGFDGMLPSGIETVVVDETHNLESKVRSSTTTRMNHQRIMSKVTSAANEIRGISAGDVQEELQSVRNTLSYLFNELRQQIQMQIERNPKEMQYAERFFFDNTAKNKLLISQAAEQMLTLSDAIEIYLSMDFRRKADSPASDELSEIAHVMKDLVDNYDNCLIWIERSGQNADLLYCPKNTKQIINELYYKGSPMTILTSATLTNTSSGTLESQYSYFIQNTGFPVGKKGIVADPKPSPYPYDEHAMIYCCNDLPHPTREHEAFIKQGVERLIELLDISHGRALVLFTAKADLDEVYESLLQKSLPYKILKQEDGSSQERTLQEFKDDVDSVLLGSGAYWEGISIEGKSLSHLIVFRLPFPIPDPIIDYKSKLSADPLMEVSVPEMIIKLKQGIGRLIRNFSDKGLVSIIDSRLKDNCPTRYHDITWDSLPIKNRTDNIEIAAKFYNQLEFEERGYL